MGVLEYSSNNSGGEWWLSDADWIALEKAGWKVDWVRDREPGPLSRGTDDRWLGALAINASIETDDPDKTISEWEQITGMDSTAEGCNCCGEPHNFYFTDDDGNKRYSHVEVVRTERKWS